VSLFAEGEGADPPGREVDLMGAGAGAGASSISGGVVGGPSIGGGSINSGGGGGLKSSCAESG